MALNSLSFAKIYFWNAILIGGGNIFFVCEAIIECLSKLQKNVHSFSDQLHSIIWINQWICPAISQWDDCIKQKFTSSNQLLFAFFTTEQFEIDLFLNLEQKKISSITITKLLAWFK